MPLGYVPLNYEEINVAAGQYTPSQVKSYNNQTYKLWQRAFFQRACSTLIIRMPEIWKDNKDLMYYCLFAYGFVGCGELAELGKWFNPVNISGYDFYYKPTKMLLANPALKGTSLEKLEMEIGKDCEVIKLTPDYMGIWDVISYYAEKIATIDVAINTAIINSKFAYVIGAKNKAAAEVLKKLFDKVNSGQPAVFFDKKLANDGTDKEEPWQSLLRDNLKSSYIVSDLLRDFQSIINDFDTEIGIPTLPYEKRERMVVAEAQSTQIDATSRSVVWYDTLKDSFERANKFLGFEGEDSLQVTLRYSLLETTDTADEEDQQPDQEGGEDGTREDNASRNVSVSERTDADR